MYLRFSLGPLDEILGLLPVTMLDRHRLLNAPVRGEFESAGCIIEIKERGRGYGKVDNYDVDKACEFYEFKRGVEGGESRFSDASRKCQAKEHAAGVERVRAELAGRVSACWKGVSTVREEGVIHDAAVVILRPFG